MTSLPSTTPGWKYLGPHILHNPLLTAPAARPALNRSARKLALTIPTILSGIFSHLTYKELIPIEQMDKVFKRVMKGKQWDPMLFRLSKGNKIPVVVHLDSGANTREFKIHPILLSLKVTRNRDSTGKLDPQGTLSDWDTIPSTILNRCAIWPPVLEMYLRYPYRQPQWKNCVKCIAGIGEKALTVHDVLVCLRYNMKIDARDSELEFHEEADLIFTDVTYTAPFCCIYYEVTLKRGNEKNVRYEVAGKNVRYGVVVKKG